MSVGFTERIGASKRVYFRVILHFRVEGCNPPNIEVGMRVYDMTGVLPDEITHSVFLATPGSSSLGSASGGSDEVVEGLTATGFRGELFIHLARDATTAISPVDYRRQVEAALRRADHILILMPAGEDGIWDSEYWGYWTARDPTRLVVVAASEAEGGAVQRARRLEIPVHATLAAACKALACDGGQFRRGGECDVPLHVWRTKAFQSWYAAQRAAGNVLLGAVVEWVFRVGGRFVLFWALHVDIHVASENRRKSNEVVIGRPDIVAVVLYRPGASLLDAEVALVREYRSSAVTLDGSILEIPCGSLSVADNEPRDAAVREVGEEIGLRLPSAAFRPHTVRQVVGTLSVHRAHVFSALLSEDQVADLRSREKSGTSYGVVEDSERTYVRVRTIGQLLNDTSIDWSTLGVILSVLRESGSGAEG